MSIKNLKNVPLLLFFILTVGLMVRFYGLSDNLPFWSDSATDLLITEKIWSAVKIFDLANLPLTGPTANTYLDSSGVGHGIFYYYLITLPAVITGFNPYGLSTLVIVINTFGIYLMYKLLQEFVPERFALFGSFLMAISNFAIVFSQITWNVNWITFFTLSSLLSFIKILQKDERFWLLFSFSGSVLTQVHVLGYPFVTLMFLPALISKRDVWPRKNILTPSILFFLIPQLPFLLSLLKHPILSGASLSYLISAIKDGSSLDYIIFLIRYLSTNFIFVRGLGENFFSILSVTWIIIAFGVTLFHLVFKKFKHFSYPISSYSLLVISWCFSVLIVLFLSKSHLEKDNNYILVFCLPLFIFLLTLLVRYALTKIILAPFGLLILFVFLYYNLMAFGKVQTATLKDHQQLATFLSAGPRYELLIPEAAIQESIFWTLNKSNSQLPQRVNNSSVWTLPLSRSNINLDNQPAGNKYMIIFVSLPEELSSCLFNQEFGALKLYHCPSQEP